jgi:hypothetical protein
MCLYPRDKRERSVRRFQRRVKSRIAIPHAKNASAPGPPEALDDGAEPADAPGEKGPAGAPGFGPPRCSAPRERPWSVIPNPPKS